MASTTTAASPVRPYAPAISILLIISTCHLLNDTVQSLITAVYPILKDSLQLSFSQLGLVTLTFQITASLLQPFVGLFTDRKPMPYSLVAGMSFSGVGVLLLSVAPTFGILLVAAGLVGVGSSVFHPESSRVARLASGGQHGLAQSIFQVGGNAGSALGPLLAALVVVPHGQRSIALFFAVIALAMLLLVQVGGWYKAHLLRSGAALSVRLMHEGLSRRKVFLSLLVLVGLVFSKYFYLASLTSYYTFY